MKKVLGLDLGTNSIGWAVVNEAESDEEKSSIVKMGVRVNPLTVDEVKRFETMKGNTLNELRTQKRGMRRNLQRYKLRRAELIKRLIEAGWITNDTVLSEDGPRTTFETYHLRARAASEEISLEQLVRVLLMINKKRGYKSSRKVKKEEDGSLIDGMDIARTLYDNGMTPGEYCYNILCKGKRHLPDFYRSDLQDELDRVWNTQKNFYPEILTSSVKEEIAGRNKSQTWAILAKYFVWTSNVDGESRTFNIEGKGRKTKGDEQKRETYRWRVDALTKKMQLEELAVVLQEINGDINSSSGYLGAISDRSKELFFNNQTVGQYLTQIIDHTPNVSLKNKVFYRQDYLDEFEKIWTCQSLYHPELTPKLKHDIRDIIIFYQRRLKSQKALIGYCEFEQQQITVVKDGKEKTITIGNKVIPRTSPLFQEFKIWQMLNDTQVSLISGKKRRKELTNDLFAPTTPDDELYMNGYRQLTAEEKNRLAHELFIKEKIEKKDVLSILFKNPKDLDLNFKVLHGNTTGATLYNTLSRIIEMSGHTAIDFKQPADKIEEKVCAILSSLGWNTDFLHFDSSQPLDSQPFFRLWHLLYSYETDNTPTGDGKLKQHIMQICNCDKEYASVISAINYDSDYGNLSAKAIRNILPYLKNGLSYDKACAEAGYRHSKSSLTKEEIENKELKDRLELLPKNSLRNPVVEKVLNQLVNVVNGIIDAYGRPDEIRVELARELKKSAKERAELTDSIADATKQQLEIKSILETKFGIAHVTRNDILRYRLYQELAKNRYNTLYSNTHIVEEEIFSKKFDIEHIIPQARLFDDSFSNKTLELRSINIEKGNKTAYDFVAEKYGEKGLEDYLNRCSALFDKKSAKLRKLKMSESDIPSDFIERDLRNTQYISRKALSMLGEVCRRVVATTGSITESLRKDWQLVDVMKEINWKKYEAAGLVEYYEDHDGRIIRQIKDWTKRNDHRHHAMDALTVAFTKPVFVQYFNNKNASEKPNSNEHAIKMKYVKEGKIIAPMPLGEFRREARKQLESILISLQTKNKVMTRNVNHTKSSTGGNKKVQLSPRGQLHEETIYGVHKEYVTTEKKVDASFSRDVIMTVCKAEHREALLNRLELFGGDAKKAFSGKNALDKNPIWINQEEGIAVPMKVKTVTLEPVCTIRKPINDKLPIDKVVDAKIRKILTDRIAEYGTAKAAFSNLDENPIWIDKEKGICLKRVKIRTGKSTQALHDKLDKDGHLMHDENGRRIPNDFIATGNNHHVAIYRCPSLDKKGQPLLDEDGNAKYQLEEVVVSFMEAVARKNQGLPVVDKNYRSEDGWKLLFTLKQNEYFVFPNDETGFNPKEIDLLNPDNFAIISPNLFRVQKFSSMYYCFRHHLETNVQDNNKLKDITWKRITSLPIMEKIVKVRVNSIGQIVSVGEY